MQIYNWTARPQQEFRDLAAAGIIVLLVVLLVMNSLAIVIRQRFTRKLRG
jgi:phosphate transport system permease protein